MSHCFALVPCCFLFDNNTHTKYAFFKYIFFGKLEIFNNNNNNKKCCSMTAQLQTFWMLKQSNSTLPT